MNLHVYLDVLGDHEGTLLLSVSSIIALFVSEFCSFSRDCIYLVNRILPAQGPNTVRVCRDVLKGVNLIQPDEVPFYLKQCALPAAVTSNGRIVHLGLCSVLRLVVKSKHSFTSLLGERKNCLKACAEVSVWTKFCEVQMPSAVEKFLKLSESINDADDFPEPYSIPVELLQLENHFSTPPVVSNISKKKHEILKFRRVAKREEENSTNNTVTKNNTILTSSSVELEHLFVEGMDILLTDLALLPCVTLILNKWNLGDNVIQPYLQKVFGWYTRVLAIPMVKETVMSVGLPISNFEPKTLAQIEKSGDALLQTKLSLIRDPDMKKEKFSQKAIDEVLTKIKARGRVINLESSPIADIRIPWETYPSSVHPKDGDLPLKRLEKKCQQLENLVAAVKLVAKPNDTIVDFCSGGGHLGLLLAFLLPHCSIVLVENKEESLSRALARIEALELTNIVAFQSNLDYFDLPFDVGVCLHGCGVATDLVLQKCLKEMAAFVVCPCCYGAIQNTHTMSYPRSTAFRDAGLSYDDYRVLVHAADQTQATISQAGQGKLAMEYVDTDRLNQAEEYGYQTRLFTLSPPTCSPKNNLLIGQPSSSCSTYCTA